MNFFIIAEKKRSETSRIESAYTHRRKKKKERQLNRYLSSVGMQEKKTTR